MMNAQRDWNLNAQKAWKSRYHQFRESKSIRYKREIHTNMRRFTYEAALERKLAAAQRTIEAQEERIEELENDVDAFEVERDQREAFEALVEFTNEDFSE